MNRADALNQLQEIARSLVMLEGSLEHLTGSGSADLFVHDASVAVDRAMRAIRSQL